MVKHRRHNQREDAGGASWKPFRTVATIGIVVSLTLSAGCGSKSTSAGSRAQPPSTKAATPSTVVLTSSTRPSTTTSSKGSSSTADTTRHGSEQPTPTLPPQLTAPSADGSSPKITVEQWTQAAEAYDATPVLDPCDAQVLDTTIGTVDGPGDSASAVDLRAFLEAFAAEMQLLARSTKSIDPTNSATLLHALVIARPELNGSYPGFVKAFEASMKENQGTTAYDAISRELSSRCAS